MSPLNILETPGTYALKPRFQNLLRPLAGVLARAGIRANHVTVFACSLSVGFTSARRRRHETYDRSDRGNQRTSDVCCADREGLGGDLPSEGGEAKTVIIGPATLAGTASKASRAPVRTDDGDVLLTSAGTTIWCVVQQRSALSADVVLCGQCD